MSHIQAGVTMVAVCVIAAVQAISLFRGMR